MVINEGSTTVLTSGLSSSVRVISGTKAASRIISASADARQNWSTTTESRAPCTSGPPTSTIWPEAASTPERSATAGGTDSAVKKESWLTPTTVGQVVRPRVEVDGEPGFGPPAWTLNTNENPPAGPARRDRTGGIRENLLYSERTPVAWGPLGLWPISNSTF